MRTLTQFLWQPPTRDALSQAPFGRGFVFVRPEEPALRFAITGQLGIAIGALGFVKFLTGKSLQRLRIERARPFSDDRPELLLHRGDLLSPFHRGFMNMALNTALLILVHIALVEMG